MRDEGCRSCTERGARVKKDCRSYWWELRLKIIYVYIKNLLATVFRSVCGLVCLESFMKKKVLKIREKMPMRTVILCRSTRCLCDIINKAWHIWGTGVCYVWAWWRWSPLYNRTSWLGVKHQLTYWWHCCRWGRCDDGEARGHRLSQHHDRYTVWHLDAEVRKTLWTFQCLVYYWSDFLLSRPWAVSWLVLIFFSVSVCSACVYLFFRIILYVNCFVLYMCREYHI